MAEVTEAAQVSEKGGDAVCCRPGLVAPVSVYSSGATLSTAVCRGDGSEYGLSWSFTVWRAACRVNESRTTGPV